MSLLAILSTTLSAGTLMAVLLGWKGPNRSARPTTTSSRKSGPDRAAWLRQAGSSLTPAQFWILSLGAGLFGWVLVTIVTGIWTLSLPLAVVGGVLPGMVLGRRRSKRLMEVQQAWPDGLRDIIASISAGMSLQRALEALVRTGPQSLRLAFGRFPLLARTAGVPAALESIREEMADPTSDRVIEVLILAHSQGGTLIPEILKDLAAATTKDVWAQEEINTQSIEQKINARVVFVLPWLVLAALTFSAGPFREFYTTPLGGLVILGGAVLSGFGILLISRLSRQPEEPRVLGAGTKPDGVS